MSETVQEEAGDTELENVGQRVRSVAPPLQSEDDGAKHKGQTSWKIQPNR